MKLKSRDICIKTRSPPASLAFVGQVKKYTTVKWLIVIAIVTVSHTVSMAIFLVFYETTTVSYEGIYFEPSLHSRN